MKRKLALFIVGLSGLIVMAALVAGFLLDPGEMLLGIGIAAVLSLVAFGLPWAIVALQNGNSNTRGPRR